MFCTRLSRFRNPICRISETKKQIFAYSSTASALRTSETDPVKLDHTHLGRFYTIDKDIIPSLYGPLVDDTYGMSEKFKKQCRDFREASLLIRRPFLTIKRDIEFRGLEKPPLKFVVYGSRGHGKSITLANLVHYGYSAGYILFNLPWLPNWMFNHKEVVPSASKEGFLDHTEDSVIWLNYFRKQNSKILKEAQLKTSNDYKWSQRENTPAGSDLLELIEHGIARPVYAAECICALVAELKLLATEEKCKVMVLIDGINSLFAEESIIIKRPDRTLCPYDKITVFQGWKQFFTNDWTGGVIITTVDVNAMGKEHRESDFPRYLLTKEGWEMLDPFVPVEVDRYTKDEVQTVIDYYLDRKWLQHPKAGTPEARQELDAVSVRNPYTLMDLCKSR